MSKDMRFRIVDRVTKIEELRDAPARTRVTISLVHDNPNGEVARMQLDLSVTEAAGFRNGGFCTLTLEVEGDRLGTRPHP